MIAYVLFIRSKVDSVTWLVPDPFYKYHLMWELWDQISTLGKYRATSIVRDKIWKRYIYIYDIANWINYYQRCLVHPLVNETSSLTVEISKSSGSGAFFRFHTQLCTVSLFTREQWDSWKRIKQKSSDGQVAFFSFWKPKIFATGVPTKKKRIPRLPKRCKSWNPWNPRSWMLG